MLDHILIVSESRLVREALAKILLSCGINKSAIACIESAEDALEYGQISPVNLLICSANLPVSNIIDFRDELAKTTKIKSLPLMILSAQNTDNNATNSILIEEKNSASSDYIYLSPPFKKHAVISCLFELTHNSLFESRGNQQRVSQPMLKHSVDASTMLSDEKATILVVDDESSNIDVVAGNLCHIYRVIAAKSGEHALKIVASNKHNIALILLDIMMPKMDGYQVCAILKESDTSANIPIIFLSAKALVEDIKYGFDLGAVDYITKPLNGDLLRARVATHIRLQQQKLALSAQVATLEENAKLREDMEKITHHDLKAPLSNILFETYRLADKTAAKSINRAVNNVVSMINNSLNLYKIEQGIYTIAPQATNVNLLINDAINAVASNSKAKNLDFALYGFDTEQLILAEPLLCLSIFNNLIKNAVEASPAGQTITFALSQENDQVVFCLTNKGVIPQDIRPRLFEKYSSSNHRAGTGLGTYSAKLMTQVQQGELTFDIIDEQQTRFTVKLPAAYAQ